MKKFRVGPILKLIIENSDIVAGTSESLNTNNAAKLYLFCGHDRVMAELLNSLGVFDMVTIPDFGTSIMMELHKDPKYEDFHIEVN